MNNYFKINILPILSQVHSHSTHLKKHSQIFYLNYFIIYSNWPLDVDLRQIWPVHCHFAYFFTQIIIFTIPNTYTFLLLLLYV